MRPIRAKHILGNPQQARHGTGRITRSNTHSRAHQVISRVGGKVIGTLDFTFGGIDVGEVHYRAGMAGIEYGGEADAVGEGGDGQFVAGVLAGLGVVCCVLCGWDMGYGG